MYLLTRYDRKRISELFEKNEYFEKKNSCFTAKKKLYKKNVGT